MEYVQTQNKIRLLFKKILEPGYVMDNYYADQLIDKMRHCAGDPEIAFLESVPLISDLIIESFTCKENCHTSVKVFLTRMLALASLRELHFAKIFAKNDENVLKEFKEINTPISPSLRVAYMELALALAQHDSGVAWLLQTGVWREVLGLCNEKQTVFVIRQTYKFAAKFLWRINDMGDDANVKLVIIHIMKPLSQIEFLKLDSVTSEEEEQILKIVEPMLQMLLLILTESHRIEQPSLIINHFQQQSVISHMYIMFDRMRKEDTIILIAQINFWLALAKMFSSKPFTPDVVYGAQDLMDLGVNFFNTIQILVSRRSATLVLDYSNTCNHILTRVWKDKKLTTDVKEVDIQKQFLFLCLVPTLVFVRCKQGHAVSEMTNEGLAELTAKMLNATCEHTARAAYALRDLTLELGVLPVTLHSVKRLTCLKAHLGGEQANLVFQVLFYVLKKFDPTESGGADDDFAEDGQDKVNVLTYVLDTVLYLVKNYNINWCQSLEVICLYNVVYCLLKRPNLSCKFVVTALNVIAVTVKKFLQPNLSLLMESRPGSAFDELGQLVYAKLQDRSWEVRDSALELLLACTEISFIKFPPFQKQITENKLINMAATLALNDYEFYVQASALKCIASASKVPLIWEELQTQFPDMQEHLLSILRNNQEGITRKEACNVLCHFYQNLKLSTTFKQTLYEHMVSSALADFHWEVQLSALKFWRMVIHSLLSGQGMLDGTFPPVTFSRETRKIVTLTETEVQKRLIQILYELSSIGCLTVLVKLLHEDTELDIIETALNISLELLNILNQYKVPNLLKPVNNDVHSIEELESNIVEEKCNQAEDIAEPETSAKSDNIIDEILNSDDINLLASIYERHMNLQGDKTTSTSKPRIKLLKRASPYFFVNHLKGTDFKAVVEQKKTWKIGIRSVSSLLDDVLGIYDINDEINSMDCY